MNREKCRPLCFGYGDHLPTLGNDFGVYASTGTITSTTAANWTEEEKYQMFSTPYVVFSNYDTGHEYRADGTPVSPYLLTALMYDYIGAPETLRSNFLLDLYAHCLSSARITIFIPRAAMRKRETNISSCMSC